jgi:hypothetical protein
MGTHVQAAQHAVTRNLLATEHGEKHADLKEHNGKVQVRVCQGGAGLGGAAHVIDAQVALLLHQLQDPQPILVVELAIASFLALAILWCRVAGADEALLDAAAKFQRREEGEDRVRG